MAVTMQQPVQIASGAWLVEWSSDQTSPTYRVWYEGAVVAIQIEAYIVIESTSEPWVEIDDGDSGIEILQETYPAIAIVQWFGDANADYYLIEKNDGGWSEVARVWEDGFGYYEYRSGILDDVTTHSYRVTPVDVVGNQGTAVSFEMLIVRNPSPPTPSLSYNAVSGELEVTHA